jgi:hypothetical protein
MANPTYSIKPNKYVITEGDINPLIFTITTTNVDDGTVLYWINNGTTITGDLSNLSGTVTISSNTGTISISANTDVITEGSESIIILIRTGSLTGPIVATSYTVIVKDVVATPPDPIYSNDKGYTGSAGGSTGVAFNYSSYYERIASSLETIALNSTAIASSIKGLDVITELASGSGIHTVGPYEWLNYASTYHLYVEQGKLNKDSEPVTTISSAGGSSGGFTITTSDLTGANLIVAGQLVKGTGVTYSIDPNVQSTYVESVASGSAEVIITLTNNLTANAAGTYEFYNVASAKDQTAALETLKLYLNKIKSLPTMT